MQKKREFQKSEKRVEFNNASLVKGLNYLLDGSFIPLIITKNWTIEVKSRQLNEDPFWNRLLKIIFINTFGYNLQPNPILD